MLSYSYHIQCVFSSTAKNMLTNAFLFDQNFIWMERTYSSTQLIWILSKLGFIFYSENLISNSNKDTNMESILKLTRDSKDCMKWNGKYSTQGEKKNHRLTRLPKIWLMAALSFSVHSATTFALISFIYNINAFNGFFIWGFFLSVEEKAREMFAIRDR